MQIGAGRLGPLVLALVLVLVAPLLPGCSSESDDSGNGAMSAAADLESEDFAAVAEVMEHRAAALLEGARPAFLATVDPGNEQLLREQGVLFDNVQRLPVEDLYYVVGTSGVRPEPVAGGDPVVRPEVVEHVKLAGALAKPVANAVSVTFVERDGTWFVGQEVLDDSAEHQARPWFGVPIEVARDGGLFVAVDDGAPVSADELLQRVRAELSAVADLVGEPADPPLLLDATSNRLSFELSQASGKDAGAVTLVLFARNRAGDIVRRPAGLAVKLNPEWIGELVTDSVLLRHELTHVVLAHYGESQPQWASEGIAEYVGTFPERIAQSSPVDAADAVETRGRDVELVPPGRWGDVPWLDYLVARATAEHLVRTYGLDRYLAMMDTFKENGFLYGGASIDAVLRETYGVGELRVARESFALLEQLIA